MLVLVLVLGEGGLALRNVSDEGSLGFYPSTRFARSGSPSLDKLGTTRFLGLP